jgi:phosphate transport system substrate-binding protein
MKLHSRSGVLIAAMLATGLTIGNPAAGHAAEVRGAGSTFVFPIMAKWSDAYARAAGDRIVYQPIGSGAGILQIKAGTVDFGASDKPLPPAELAQAGLLQFPLVFGGVVPIFNITGLRPGQLRFSGPVLADIYLGKITRWNDPGIARLNPRVRLPATGIKVVYRSDGSGTTFNWAHYLSAVSPEWRQRVGEGTTVEWPVGSGAKGSTGVASYVQLTPNAIGYIESAYVMERNLTFGLVQNAAGRFVAPTGRAVQLAAATGDWAHSKDFHIVVTNAPGADAYPITATTFVLMYRTPRDRERSTAALRFFRWAMTRGQGQAESLSYVPLPASLVQQVEAHLAAGIK